jgi:hypothetical protein
MKSVLTRRAILGAIMAAPLLPGLALGQNADGTNPQRGASSMKIRIVFHDQDFTATLYDNVSTRHFASMLPLDLTIKDFANNEKIAYLPRKLNDGAKGPFPNAAPGDLCYYTPWGNLAFFYGGYESTRDLVRLGRLDGDTKSLLTRGEYPVRIEALP